jgi:hypothetical protein
MASILWLAVASGGLILWQSAFVLLYAGLGLGCALQFRDMHARELVPREMNWWSDLLGRCPWQAVGRWEPAPRNQR